MYKGIEVIAEVKTRSPYGFKSDYRWRELFEVANDIGDVISIHTDDRWGGSFSLIKKARKLTDKPILAKGIHNYDDDIERAIRYGADYVLVVDRVPDIYGDKCWIEPIDLKQLKRIPRGYKVVWNERDLTTGRRGKEKFREVRRAWPGWLCQASFVKDVYDMEFGADAVLVGENLVDFAESLRKHSLRKV